MKGVDVKMVNFIKKHWTKILLSVMLALLTLMSFGIINKYKRKS